MNVIQLITRIYEVLERLDPKHPNVKKVNKILSTVEKALLSWAKVAGIRIDDIKEIKNEEDLDVDKKEGDEDENGEETSEDINEKPESNDAVEGEDEYENDMEGDKKIKIKAMFWKLSPEKQEKFKWKMWDKFSSLGL